MAREENSGSSGYVLKTITKNIPPDFHFLNLQAASVIVCFISLGFLAVGLYFVSQDHEVGIKLCIFSIIFDTLWSSYVQYRLRGFAKLDEREVFVQWKAISTGALITCAIAVGWVFLLASDDSGQVWRPTKPDDWWAVAIFFFGAIGQISGLAAASLNLLSMRSER